MMQDAEKMGEHEKPVNTELISSTKDIDSTKVDDKIPPTSDKAVVPKVSSEETVAAKPSGEKTASDKDGSDEKKENDDEKPKEKEEADTKAELPRTRIGRPNKDNKSDIIDQADWQTTVPRNDIVKKYVIVVKDGRDGRAQVTLYSPYIQKVFRAVIRYVFFFNLPRSVLTSILGTFLRCTSNGEALASVTRTHLSIITSIRCKSLSTTIGMRMRNEKTGTISASISTTLT